MRLLLSLVVIFLFCASSFQEVEATLIDRGNGLIYDQDANITWMQDSNYAQHGSSSSGSMNWTDAMAWVANLEYGGFSDWRLPTAGISLNEMGHLYYDELGNIGHGTSPKSGPFVPPFKLYWLANDLGSSSLAFDTEYGITFPQPKEIHFFVWAVRTGDVIIPDTPLSTVPEPSTIALLWVGILGLVGVVY